jgi:hypothetical protein
MKTKKTKPKTAQQLLVDKIMGEVARIRQDKKLPPETAKAEAALDVEAAQLFNRTNNRDNATTLDSVTALDRIDRDGGPTFDRIGKWKPAMEADPESLKPLAAEIAAARERVESDKLKKMTDAERALYALEQQQTKILADESAAAKHAQRMADPKVKSVLDKLRKLDTDTAKDESWDYAETVAIARAIFALETQGSDLTAALALADEAFGIQRQKNEDAKTAHQKEIDRLNAQMALLSEKPAEQQQTETKTDAPAENQTEGKSTWKTLRETYDKLKADPNASHTALSAAHKSYMDALLKPIAPATESGDGSATTEGAAT